MTPNELAKDLLQNGKISVVVGYTEGTIPGKTQTLIRFIQYTFLCDFI